MEDSKHERNNVRDEGYYAQSWEATGQPHPLLWETCTTLAIKETINKSDVAQGATMFHFIFQNSSSSATKVSLYN